MNRNFINLSLEHLLKIEEPEILNFRFTINNLPMWLFIRHYVFWEILKTKKNLAEPHVKPQIKNMNFIDKFNYLKNIIKKYPFFIRKNYDIVILGAAVNNVFENGFYVNRLYDNFYFIFPEKTMIFEISNKFYFPEPRKVDSFSIELYYIIRKIYSKFKKPYKEDLRNIDIFINFLISNFEKIFIQVDGELKNNIKKQLINISNRLVINNYFYRYMLNKLNPKVLIIEDAHYGGYTDLIYISKKLGKIVIEPQHGYVGKDHLAYNFNQKLFEYIKEFLPDYFLTFGKFWSDNIRTPSERIEIGFPYLEEKVNIAKQLKNQEIRDKKNILIISGGSCPEEYNNLVKNLYNLLDKDRFKIVFRPHPSERIALNERYKDIISMGVEIDLDNIYESLFNYDIVLSFEKSTVIYEAIAFGAKVVLIKHPNYNFLDSSNNVFLESEYNFDIIVDIIKDDSITYSIDSINYIWQPNSLSNYKNFIKSIGVNINDSYNRL
jgi:hypothetical protein